MRVLACCASASCSLRFVAAADFGLALCFRLLGLLGSCALLSLVDFKAGSSKLRIGYYPVAVGISPDNLGLRSRTVEVDIGGN